MVSCYYPLYTWQMTYNSPLITLREKVIAHNTYFVFVDNCMIAKCVLGLSFCWIQRLHGNGIGMVIIPCP